MSEYEAPYIPGEIGPLLETETKKPTPEHISDWEYKILGREQFKVKKGRVFPETRNGEDVVWNIDTYHHLETGTQITMFSLGMQRPVNEPAPVRPDYECPCMVLGSASKIPSHDCAQQRDMMFDTVAQLGIGVIAVVSEQTAAGNGHGAHVVFDQSTAQYTAAQRGETPPTMPEFYSQQGYFPFDNRRQDLVNLAIIDAVGSERPIIPATSNLRKIEEFRQSGLNIMDGTRLDLVTDTSGIHDQLQRRDNYAAKLNVPQPGPYLVSPYLQKPTMLTRDTYDLIFRQESVFVRKPQVSPRRIVN